MYLSPVISPLPELTKTLQIIVLSLQNILEVEITKKKQLILKLFKINNLKINPLSANPTKWSNILKQFVGNLLTICLTLFHHFVKLTLKGLIVNIPNMQIQSWIKICSYLLNFHLCILSGKGTGNKGLEATLSILVAIKIMFLQR